MLRTRSQFIQDDKGKGVVLEQVLKNRLNQMRSLEGSLLVLREQEEEFISHLSSAINYRKHFFSLPTSPCFTRQQLGIDRLVILDQMMLLLFQYYKNGEMPIIIMRPMIVVDGHNPFGASKWNVCLSNVAFPANGRRDRWSRWKYETLWVNT